MDHNDVRHKLSEYIDGSSTSEERAAIEAHLKTCTQCSDALSELRKTIEHIKTVEEIEPPAWMKQKIMVKVRAEAETRKGFFERLFSPLSIKLPIQAVSMVFLAVTAFYIYRSIQPGPAPSEAPTEEFASNKETKKDTAPKSNDQPRGATQVPQAPEYKALDMKQEYEKPAAPRLADKMEIPAPASPAKSAEQRAPETRYAAEPQAGAPAGAVHLDSRDFRAFDAHQEESAHVSGLTAAGEPQSEGTMRTAKAALSEGSAGNAIALTMTVKEFDAAEKEIEKTVTMLGGKVIKTAPPVDTSALTVSINRNKLSELLLKMKTIGNVKEKVPAAIGGEGFMTVRITLIHK